MQTAWSHDTYTYRSTKKRHFQRALYRPSRLNEIRFLLTVARRSRISDDEPVDDNIFYPSSCCCFVKVHRSYASAIRDRTIHVSFSLLFYSATDSNADKENLFFYGRIKRRWKFSYRRIVVSVSFWCAARTKLSRGNGSAVMAARKTHWLF